MIKGFLSFLIIIFFSISSNAATDTYTALWKQVDDAQRKDLPATQLRILTRIADKATRERAYGHLMKARIQSVYVKGAISPDSLLPAVQRLEAIERQVSSSDPVLAAVYQSMLGHLYRHNRLSVDDAAKKSADYYKQSLQQPELLAQARTTTFEPFVDKGVDSRIFNNDMLHVLAMEAGDYTTPHKYYLAAGNRPAACIMALKKAAAKWNDISLDIDRKDYARVLDSLTAEYIDLPEASEVAIERYQLMASDPDVKVEDKIAFIDKAIERWGSQQRINVLRNARRMLTQPSWNIEITDAVFASGQPIRVNMSNLRNVGQLRLTVRRLNVTGDTSLDPNQPTQYAKLKKLIVPGTSFTQTRKYNPLPEYKVDTDTIEMKGLAAGVYLLDVSTDNAAMPVRRSLIRVSDLYVLLQALPENNIRLIVTDAMSGMPVSGAHIKLTISPRMGRDNKVETLTSDVDGEVRYACPPNANIEYWAYTDKDKNYPKLDVYNHFSYYSNTEKRSNLRLYTDRSIYRPGQTVHVAALAYDYYPTDISCRALNGRALTLTLRDANNKEVASRKVVTDAYGKASADFVLPKDGLTGSYTVRSEEGLYHTISFSVEEYKRPTFIVEFDKVKHSYQAGDTVIVSGTAKSYAGVPVQGARVVYKVTRRQPWFWSRYAYNEPSAVLAGDTVVTDNEGRFDVRVPVVVPQSHNSPIARFYSFSVNADVTDMSGETRTGEMSLPYGSRPTVFQCNMPEIINRDCINNVVFDYKNVAGENLEGDVTYLIDGHKYTCKTNTAVALPVADFASGRHDLTAYCGNDTITRHFVTFSFSDEKLAHDTPDWFFVSSEQFSADGQPVRLQAGASDTPLHVVYTVVSGNRIIESGHTRLADGKLLNREFTYKPEYGDGISIALAWVKNGKSYCHTALIKRPVPDTRLILKWKTFRDRLTPGQNEQWTLNVSRPDGKQAEAQLMALLYDKSLDQLRKHSWTFYSPVNLYIPYLMWSGRTPQHSYLGSSVTYKLLKEKPLDFSKFYLQRVVLI
ncbi:MAG: MG2 domain-containing protein, partial [Prevotella sp.]